jgi:hypothetical protein
MSIYFPQTVVPQGRTKKRKIIFLRPKVIEEEGTIQPQKLVSAQP